MLKNEMKCGGQTMICKCCGNEIDDHSQFCFVCGQKIDAPVPEAQAQTDALPAEPASAETLPVSEPAAAEEYAAVDPKDVQKAGKFTRFICFICPLIGAIIYMIRAKQGETGKKRSVANATMSGVCLYLIIGILFVVKKSMF